MRQSHGIRNPQISSLEVGYSVWFTTCDIPLIVSMRSILIYTTESKAKNGIMVFKNISGSSIANHVKITSSSTFKSGTRNLLQCCVIAILLMKLANMRPSTFSLTIQGSKSCDALEMRHKKKYGPCRPKKDVLHLRNLRIPGFRSVDITH